MKAIATTAVALALVVLGFMAGWAAFVLPQQPTQTTATAKLGTGVRYAVLTGDTLAVHNTVAKMTVNGSGKVFAAYGTESNITAWLHGQKYAQVTFTADSKQGTVKQVTAPAVKNVVIDPVLNPAGADLWLDQRSASRQLTWALNLPATSSVLIAADGTNPAPATVSATWAIPTVSYVFPLMLGAFVGVGLAGLAAIAASWFIMRRSRRAKLSRRARQGLIVAAVILPLLTANTAHLEPATAAIPPGQQSSLTDTQAQRILENVMAAATAADAKQDNTVLASRVTGPALEEQQAAYTIAAKKKAKTVTQLMHGSAIAVILPEATAAWPRTLFSVITGSADTSPQALTLRQDTPRGNYKLVSVVDLQAGAQLPNLPSSLKGTTRLDNATNVLKTAPAEIADLYGQVLRDSTTDANTLFDTTTDMLYASVGPAVKKASVKSLGSTAKTTYGNPVAHTVDTTALASAGSAAIVSVYVEEQYTTKPDRAGVTIKPTGDTKLLAGISKTTRGVESTYGYQLLFLDPGAGSDDKLQLLGFTAGLISAAEIPKPTSKD